MRELFLKNAYVYRGRDFAPADVLVQEGVLAAVGPDIHYPVGTQVLDLNGMALVPGFIDVHTHGGDGIDVNAAAARDLQKIGAFFARHGTTSWLCSILTDTEQQTLWCIDQARQAIECPGPGARLLGIHLEGPFLPPHTRAPCRSICFDRAMPSCSAATKRLPGARCATSPSRRRWRACWR